MKKLTLIALFTALAILLFGISSFAANNIASDAVHGVRNIVGGAENALSGAATGITNGMKNIMNTDGNNTENNTRNTNDNNMMAGGITDNSNNGRYNAARTATTTRMATAGGTNATFLGMGATAWTWLIMAIVGIVTIALVWYYGKERELNYNHNEDNY